MLPVLSLQTVVVKVLGVSQLCSVQPSAAEIACLSIDHMMSLPHSHRIITSPPKSYNRRSIITSHRPACICLRYLPGQRSSTRRRIIRWTTRQLRQETKEQGERRRKKTKWNIIYTRQKHRSPSHQAGIEWHHDSRGNSPRTSRRNEKRQPGHCNPKRPRTVLVLLASIPLDHGTEIIIALPRLLTVSSAFCRHIRCRRRRAFGAFFGFRASLLRDCRRNADPLHPQSTSSATSLTGLHRTLDRSRRLEECGLLLWFCRRSGARLLLCRLLQHFRNRAHVQFSTRGNFPSFKFE